MYEWDDKYGQVRFGISSTRKFADWRHFLEEEDAAEVFLLREGLMGDDEDSANLFGKSCGEVLGFIIMESCD